MKFNKIPIIDLRRLILLFALVTSLVTLANSFYAAYRVQRDALVANAQEANRAYAAKVASSIDEFLRVVQQKLAYSAGLLGDHFGDPGFVAGEARRLKTQDPDFSSVTIADASGRVLAAMPDSLRIDGKTLASPGVGEALRGRRPTISSAYNSAAGNLIVFISHPIWSKTGEYLGFVGGSIYLKEKTVLSTLIGNHFYRDATYAYVADGNRRLLYHPDAARVGEVIGKNPAVEAALKGESGAMPLVNSQGTEMLAGYAGVPSANWGVVSQQPRSATLGALHALMRQMVLGAAPLGIVGLLTIWWLSRLITRPLQQLAENATAMDSLESTERIRTVDSWYIEAAHIKQALLKGMGLMQEKLSRLSSQAHTDPLTGLLNRRAMTEALDLMEAAHRPFAIVAFDIDHFKRVNDSFGHDAGDLVLATVARLLRQCSREGDLACRQGGEEFALLLPETTVADAAEVGERLRQLVQQTAFEIVGHVTISLGVASWPGSGARIADALKRADDLMYQAKQGGRNRLARDAAG
ncbi:sensor domain-containing diguanylate cyclase [Cupriavidus sp. 30B13]|uniref:sensor domain-containing diguanylate cyclase n=1 Tax=Cupriavidus sp. 30B13 TaxID=3384241 RepID=UPI003B91B2A5